MRRKKMENVFCWPYYYYNKHRQMSQIYRIKKMYINNNYFLYIECFWQMDIT